MQRLVISIIILSLTGCGTPARYVNCIKEREQLNWTTMKLEKVKYESTCYEPAKAGWGKDLAFWLLFPVVVVAGIPSGGSNNSHYDAGGAAYKDYTLPANQPLPTPPVNGGGRYGNYPLK